LLSAVGDDDAAGLVMRLHFPCGLLRIGADRERVAHRDRQRHRFALDHGKIDDVRRQQRGAFGPGPGRFNLGPGLLDHGAGVIDESDMKPAF